MATYMHSYLSDVHISQLCTLQVLLNYYSTAFYAVYLNAKKWAINNCDLIFKNVPSTHK